MDSNILFLDISSKLIVEQPGIILVPSIRYFLMESLLKVLSPDKAMGIKKLLL